VNRPGIAVAPRRQDTGNVDHGVHAADGIAPIRRVRCRLVAQVGPDRFHAGKSIGHGVWLTNGTSHDHVRTQKRGHDSGTDKTVGAENKDSHRTSPREGK